MGTETTEGEGGGEKSPEEKFHGVFLQLVTGVDLRALKSGSLVQMVFSTQELRAPEQVI